MWWMCEGTKKNIYSANEIQNNQHSSISFLLVLLWITAEGWFDRHDRRCSEEREAKPTVRVRVRVRVSVSVSVRVKFSVRLRVSVKVN